MVPKRGTITMITKMNIEERRKREQKQKNKYPLNYSLADEVKINKM